MMMTTTEHWAADLIGRSYDDVGQCWGLVCIVFARRHQIDLAPWAASSPSANMASPTANTQAMREAARASGWRRIGSPMQPQLQGGRARVDDVLLMQGTVGRHVGVMIDVDGHLRLLHATRSRGVVHQPLRELPGDGFTQFEIWRRRA